MKWRVANLEVGETIVPFRFFGNLDHFTVKLIKHILSPEEPWSRLLGRKRLKKICKNQGSPTVSELEEIYYLVCDELYRGMKFAAEAPVYLKTDLIIEKRTSRKRRKGYCFLARHGYCVITDRNTVLTTRFPTGHHDDSYYSLFHAMWKKLKLTCGLTKRVDDRGRTIRNVEIEKISPENWNTCPNPHKRARTKPQRLRSDSLSQLGEKAWGDVKQGRYDVES